MIHIQILLISKKPLTQLPYARSGKWHTVTTSFRRSEDTLKHDRPAVLNGPHMTNSRHVSFNFPWMTTAHESKQIH